MIITKEFKNEKYLAKKYIIGTLSRHSLGGSEPMLDSFGGSEPMLDIGQYKRSLCN